MSKQNASSIAIQCENIGKRYMLGEHNSIFTAAEFVANRLKGLLGGKSQQTEANPENEFWALQNISFTLEKGQVLGLIGRNGSGKSTLLKILSRITPPTTGQFHYNGTIASLLEVGTGFKQELTGYDNIFLAGTTLGLARKDIQSKLDEIIDFAELGKFINTPVKRYSSGMYVRLAFAVAAHLEPDILLLDEVLAVGDQKFQKKCLKKMGSVAGEGRTVVFVSHNLMAVTQLCQQALLLEHGQLISSGDIQDIVRLYQDRNRSKTEAEGLFQYTQEAGQKAWIKSIQIGSRENPKLNFDILESIPLRIEVQVEEKLDNAQLMCNIHCLDGQCVLSSREVDGYNFDHEDKLSESAKDVGTYLIDGSIPGPLLNAGFYEFCFYINTSDDRVIDSKLDIQVEVHDYQSSFSSCITSALAPGVIVHPIHWQTQKTNS